MFVGFLGDVIWNMAGLHWDFDPGSSTFMHFGLGGFLGHYLADRP